MKRILSVLVLFFGMSAVAAAEDEAPAPDSPAFPAYVMNKIDDQYRGLKSHGVMEMKVKTKRFEREMSLESWSLGRDYSLIRILRPKKEKGSSTLKAKNDLYTYLAKTDRTIKITSNMMGGAWMGSHFTNDDLVRHNRLADVFDIELLTSKDDVHKFELTPKPRAAVVWGKVEITVRKSDLQPLSQLFFDEKGRKVRLLEFSEHKEVGDRVMPMRMVVRPLDGSGEYTEVRWKQIDFSVKLKKSFFSIQNLKSM